MLVNLWFIVLRQVTTGLPWLVTSARLFKKDIMHVISIYFTVIFSVQNYLHHKKQRFLIG